ncbi:MAG: hypothetical protein ACM359_16510, partial [Bacillota bacterium]
GGAPFHPKCSKSTRPFIEELATRSQAAAAHTHEPSMLSITPSEAQRRFKQLQIRQQVEGRYAHTADKLYG